MKSLKPLGTLRGADMLLMTLRLPVALSVTVRLRVLCHLLLRLADFCGAPQRALAKTGALHRSQLPVSAAGSGRCSRPHRGRQEHARGCRAGCGKANLLTASPYTLFAGFDGGTLGSPFGGAGERSETERAISDTPLPARRSVRSGRPRWCRCPPGGGGRCWSRGSRCRR